MPVVGSAGGVDCRLEISCAAPIFVHLEKLPVVAKTGKIFRFPLTLRLILEMLNALELRGQVMSPLRAAGLKARANNERKRTRRLDVSVREIFL
jgi:hypothetical protein